MVSWRFSPYGYSISGIHGPWLSTLQNDGVHGRPRNTLQGEWKNGVALTVCSRDRHASAGRAEIIPAAAMATRTIKRARIEPGLASITKNEACDGWVQGGL